MQEGHLPVVNVTGYLSGVMGTGEHARQLVAAFRTQGVPTQTTTLHPGASPEDEDLAEPANETGYAGGAPTVTLLCVNADSVPGVADQLGGAFFVDRYMIGFWAWEVSAFPQRFAGAFDYLDEVWVGSRHVCEAVGARAPIPVIRIPQPVSLRSGSASAATPAGLPDGFLFLFAFDYLSVFERKNPLATIEAFTRAFAPGSGAVLIVKTLNHDYDPAARDRLRAAVAVHPDIHLFEDRLTRSERDGLISAADCYVSLHRAEGFGYTLAEAMWLGKPVIATGYSGNLDYMTEGNSYLVSHRMVPIGPGHSPYPSDGVWADPDGDHAATLMREVFEHRAQALRRGERAAAEIRATHAPEVAGRAMAERLAVVSGSPTWRSSVRRARLHAARAAEMVQAGPTAPSRPRHGAAQRAARRLLLRAVKPLHVHQDLVDGELLSAIEALSAGMESLGLARACPLDGPDAPEARGSEASRRPAN